MGTWVPAPGANTASSSSSHRNDPPQKRQKLAKSPSSSSSWGARGPASGRIHSPCSHLAPAHTPHPFLNPLTTAGLSRFPQ